MKKYITETLELAEDSEDLDCGVYLAIDANKIIEQLQRERDELMAHLAITQIRAVTAAESWDGKSSLFDHLKKATKLDVDLSPIKELQAMTVEGFADDVLFEALHTPHGEEDIHKGASIYNWLTYCEKLARDYAANLRGGE